ncbi:MAG: formate--tetrahydrofolate ligase [Rhodospirillaceae bacterium]|jgi:formate--tetrahydrofolate ligase|nr:formate--tetrahydrofolate ligase [Rhodospirillaceae bacterium]MBT5658819.1 formate--tetrahydrofolate ligase [Rhodospirillaceae bacterium]MBT5752340.1 formate--tetrahydrofolate ligase [Rhodospirillaceae bacterium]
MAKSKSAPKSDIDIARAAKMHPILQLADKRLGIKAKNLEPYGHYKAKMPLTYIDGLKKKKDGHLILVTAMTPTTAGEGKTTTSVGLADGLNKIGKKTIVALREPSLGPVFGMKGGAAGGGYAQVVPMADINLHFTGDMHAIGAAHNLLSAMVDNHVYWGHAPLLDSRRIAWRRVVDMNDRALRQITVGLGGVANGFAREDGYDITVASEVMAILCLANNITDLQKRLGNIIVGYTRDRKPVTARELKADGAMTALLKDALQPNLVQTLENNPAFIHGGPFANIAHGCNTVLATKTALKLADYVVTEGGFGADLGAEKFLNIKCRKAKLKPSCVVVVATVRALKLHGGVDSKKLGPENLGALAKGIPNLLRHVENMDKFGLPVVVAINRFPTDTANEVELVQAECKKVGVKAVLAEHWEKGGAGARKLAKEVVKTIDAGKANFKLLYPDKMPLVEKIRTIAKEIYRADDISLDGAVAAKLADIEKMGFGHYPICMAKTQYSFSTNPALKCAPTGFTVPIRDVRLSAGAEFVVVLSGNIMTMPGLPRVPAAEVVGVDKSGEVTGLF